MVVLSIPGRGASTNVWVDQEAQWRKQTGTGCLSSRNMDHTRHQPVVSSESPAERAPWLQGNIKLLHSNLGRP